MQARELFHKAHRPGSQAARGVLAFLVLLVACGPTDGGAVAEAEATPRAVVATPPTSGPPAGHAWIIFGADTVVAEVAATADERARGLMYREEVPDGSGMLFVFPDVQVRSFWMANTYVPLDIAFMDPAFRVVDIVAMEPLVTESYVSAVPAMYGLEVRQGWYEEQGIPVGAQANVVFGVAAAR